MKTRKISIILCVCALLSLVTCKTTPQYSDLAEELASARYGYFTLREHNKKGEYGPVFIFTERHNSRLIQAEIAWGLDVLREKRGINKIALEGMFIGEVMDAEKLEYDSETEKYIVTLAMLEHGEIKAPELMYLAKDSFVFGMEDEEQYNVMLPSGAYNAVLNYSIMSIGADYGIETLDAVYAKLQGVLDDAKREWLFSQYPWIRETLEIVNGYRIRSTVIISNRLAELEEKVGQLAFGLSPQIRADFGQLKKFYEVAYQRSLTMTGHVLDTLQNKNEPLSMIIGYAHTLEVVDFFEKNNVSYYVLEPDGSYDDIWSDLSDVEYERRSAGTPLFTNNQIESFFRNDHSPRPFLVSDLFKKTNEMFSLTQKMIALALSDDELERGESFLYSNRVWVPLNSADISNSSDIKFSFEDERGTILHARAVLNPQGNVNSFENFQKELEKMRERLYQIDEQNLPFSERIKAISEIIEVFNVGNYSVFISPSDEVWKIDINAL